MGQSQIPRRWPDARRLCLAAKGASGKCKRGQWLRRGAGTGSLDEKGRQLRRPRGIKLTIKISGVKWTETAKVIRRGNAVVLEVMTKAGRLYRSTSFRLTKKEAAKLAAELQQAASSNQDGVLGKLGRKLGIRPVRR
jgi:hypothetical protein